MITIGTMLLLKEKNPESKDSYRCKVIDHRSNMIFVDYPVNVKTNKTAHLSLHKPFSVAFLVERDVYEFTASKITRYDKLVVPALAIPLPHKEELRRIQRRKFVQVDAIVDVSIHCPDHSFLPFCTVTNNISGGGASIIIPSSNNIHIDKRVILYIVLRFSANNFEYIRTHANIVRVQEHGTVTYASIKFLFDNRMQLEKVIKYCFQHERNKRKQNLLQ